MRNLAVWHFEPRPESEIDTHLAKLINEHFITLPIVHVKNKVYLVGAQRVSLELRVMKSRANRSKQ